MDLKTINQEDLSATLETVAEACQATQLDYFLLGALARDQWYARSKKIARATQDIDIAIYILNPSDYKTIKDYLEKNKNYQPATDNEFAMWSPEGILVDIFPCGALEIEDGIIIEGAALTSVPVNGLIDVFHHGTALLPIAKGLSFEVASIPAIVLLKLIAFDDRPEMRHKDAADIADILEHFFEIHANDLIYTQHVDLFKEDGDINLQGISAIVIGREIRKITGDNADLRKRLGNILAGHITLFDKSPFIRQMLTGDKTIQSQAELLQLIQKGLEL